jgi:hypothetical protein
MRVVLLTMLNSGLLSTRDVSEVLGLSSVHQGGPHCQDKN